MKLRQVTLLLDPDVYEELRSLSRQNGKRVSEVATGLMGIGLVLGSLVIDPECHVYIEEAGEMHEITMDKDGGIRH